MIGVTGGLLVTGQPFGFVALLGLLSLSGMLIKNVIVLIEAINLVKSDFAKILVITHLDELKDAFPMRIEVEKTAQGSELRVI